MVTLLTILFSLLPIMVVVLALDALFLKIFQCSFLGWLDDTTEQEEISEKPVDQKNFEDAKEVFISLKQISDFSVTNAAMASESKQYKKTFVMN